MKDLIDERNFREKCARSIVKGYNVRYVMPGEQKVETEEVEEAAAVQEAGNPKGVLDDEGIWEKKGQRSGDRGADTKDFRPAERGDNGAFGRAWGGTTGHAIKWPLAPFRLFCAVKPNRKDSGNRPANRPCAPDTNGRFHPAGKQEC